MTTLTAIVLTKNEAIHIERAIRNLQGWAERIIILDSYSEDNTAQLAESVGAEVIFRAFDNYKNQRQYAIDYCKDKTEWVLFLDADETLLPGLKKEIMQAIKVSNVNGYYLSRRLYFMGRWIKHGGYYPTYLLRLFRPTYASVDREINEHIVVTGVTKKLKHDFIHNDLKGID